MVIRINGKGIKNRAMHIVSSFFVIFNRDGK